MVLEAQRCLIFQWCHQLNQCAQCCKATKVVRAATVSFILEEEEQSTISKLCLQVRLPNNINNSYNNIISDINCIQLKFHPHLQSLYALLLHAFRELPICPYHCKYLLCMLAVYSWAVTDISIISVALPSPGMPGTFVFPPSTPTSLIAPISLPGRNKHISTVSLNI